MNLLLKRITAGLFSIILLVGSNALAEDKLSDISESNPFHLDSFAIIDIQRILEESKAAKSAKAQVSKLKKKYADQAKKRIESLRKEEQMIKKQQKALSPEAFTQKVKKFQAKYEDGKKEAFKKGKIVEAAYAKALGLIKNNVVKIVAQIAAERKIDLVLSKGQLLYAKGGVEITEDIISKLNKKLKTVNISVK